MRIVFLTRGQAHGDASIDQYVIPGNIIVRQRGTLFHPGQHVGHSALQSKPTRPLTTKPFSGRDRTRPHHLRDGTRFRSVLQGKVDAGRAQVRWCCARKGRRPPQRRGIPRNKSLVRTCRPHQVQDHVVDHIALTDTRFPSCISPRIAPTASIVFSTLLIGYHWHPPSRLKGTSCCRKGTLGPRLLV